MWGLHLYIRDNVVDSMTFFQVEFSEICGKILSWAVDLLVDRRRHCPLHWHPLDEQSSLGRGRQQWQGVRPSVYPAANPPMASPLDPFLWLALPNTVKFVDFFFYHVLFHPVTPLLLDSSHKQINKSCYLWAPKLATVSSHLTLHITALISNWFIYSGLFLLIHVAKQENNR